VGPGSWGKIYWKGNGQWRMSIGSLVTVGSNYASPCNGVLASSNGRGKISGGYLVCCCVMGRCWGLWIPAGSVVSVCHQ